MALSRRAFLGGLGGGGAGGSVLAALVAARGHEEAVAEWTGGSLPVIPPPAPGEIRIGGNENPLGPGKVALDALVAQFDQSGRYPFNSRVTTQDLVNGLAEKYDAKPENIVAGAGSTGVLRNCVRISCGPGRHIVTGDPSYGSPISSAKKFGIECREIPLDNDLRLDLSGLDAASRGAGMVYFCNPNNPPATIHPASAIESLLKDVQRASPDTLILIDEAYHDYVTDPAHATMIPLALSRPNLVVARTFSKAYGMAGLRLGFGCGHPDTMKKLRRYLVMCNVPAIAAGVASLQDPDHIDRERQRNAEVRRFTLDFFEKAGYRSTETETNFLFVNLRRPAKEFREACAKDKVFVGRDFPPMEKTHCRISLGTMDEMRRATEVFAKVLGIEATDAAAP